MWFIDLSDIFQLWFVSQRTSFCLLCISFPIDLYFHYFSYLVLIIICFAIIILFSLLSIKWCLNSQQPNICYSDLEIFNQKLTIQMKILLKETSMCFLAKNIKLHMNLCKRIWCRLLSCIICYHNRIVFPDNAV